MAILEIFTEFLRAGAYNEGKFYKNLKMAIYHFNIDFLN